MIVIIYTCILLMFWTLNESTWIDLDCCANSVSKLTGASVGQCHVLASLHLDVCDELCV